MLKSVMFQFIWSLKLEPQGLKVFKLYDSFTDFQNEQLFVLSFYNSAKLR